MMLKKILKGVFVSLLAIGVFLGVMLFVQNINNDLDDIVLIVNNFKRVNTIPADSSIQETISRDDGVIYRIGNADTVMVLQLDKEWVNNQKGMKCWKGHTADETTDTIMTSEPTYWQLTLKETNLGVIALYKEIYMNQQAFLDSESVLKDVLEGNK